MPAGGLDPARLAVLADAPEEAVARDEMLVYPRAPRRTFEVAGQSMLG